MKLSGKRVLAVDEDAGALGRLAEVLREAGADVIAVDAAEYALPAVVFLDPDLVVVDVGLPHAGGLTLVRHLRALPAEQGGLIPALALSALPPSEDALEEWRTAGFQRHLPKSTAADELIGVVAELMGYQRGRDASSASASPEGSGRAK